MTEPTIHASAVRLGGQGVLIRGASGAGKSRLALALLDQAGIAATSAAAACVDDHETALIADDRVVLTSCEGKLFASAPQSLQGRIEMRGVGILTMPWCSRAQLHMLVDLTPFEAMERLPQSTSITLEGVELSHLAVPITDLAHQLLMVRTALALAATRNVTKA